MERVEVDDFTDFLELPASLRAALSAKRGEILKNPEWHVFYVPRRADFEWLSALSYHRPTRVAGRSGNWVSQAGVSITLLVHTPQHITLIYASFTPNIANGTPTACVQKQQGYIYFYNAPPLRLALQTSITSSLFPHSNALLITILLSIRSSFELPSPVVWSQGLSSLLRITFQPSTQLKDTKSMYLDLLFRTHYYLDYFEVLSHLNFET